MTPFTLAEANEIWDDFEDLKDTEFKYGGPAVLLVHDVVVCPFPEEDKQKFIDNYSQTKDSRQALGFYYGTYYDVLLVAADADDEADFTYISIRAFAAEKGIRYSFPENA